MQRIRLYWQVFLVNLSVLSLEPVHRMDGQHSCHYTDCHKYVPVQTMFNVRNIYFQATKLSKNMTTLKRFSTENLMTESNLAVFTEIIGS